MLNKSITVIAFLVILLGLSAVASLVTIQTNTVHKAIVKMNLVK